MLRWCVAELEVADLPSFFEQPLGLTHSTWGQSSPAPLRAAHTEALTHAYWTLWIFTLTVTAELHAKL